jgi:spore germination protein YaaH
MPPGISQIAASSVKHVPILQFYEIGSPASETRMSEADFQALMDWLWAQGYVPQKLSDYIKWMRGEIDLPKKSVVLAFYGAFLSQYTLAFPKLQSLGFKFNLMIPGSYVAGEDAVGIGSYLSTAKIREMVGSGLAEPHSAGWHQKWSFQGIPATVARLYTSSGFNLKWGGGEELVDDAYSYAPLIGTNEALETITTTYAFSLDPRGYRQGSVRPLQVLAKYLALDRLTVQGTAYSPSVKIEARKVGEETWTALKAAWQPTWTELHEVIELEAPFTFKTEVQYELRFTTLGSPAGAAGELVTLGSRTAQGNGVSTICASNSSTPGFVSGDQIGGELWLLESLASENAEQVKARVLSDARTNLNFLAPLMAPNQLEVAFAYPLNTYSSTGIFMPSTLRAVHPLQMIISPLVTDRWSNMDLAIHSNAPAGFPLRQMTAALGIDGTRDLAHLENQIDSFSGALWDVDPTWGAWAMALGWINEFASEYETELKQHARAWTHLTSTLVKFNSDGVSFDAADIVKLQSFLQRPEIQGIPVLVRVSNEADTAKAHNIFANPTASIQAILDLFSDSAPRLAGVAIDIEGAVAADRSLASAWITGLRQAHDAQFPGRTILAAVPAKTADFPTDPWFGWCDYAVWSAQADILFPMTYDYSDQQASQPPGPVYPWQWMHDVMAYAASTTSKSKLMVGLAFYGIYRTGGPAWSAPQLVNYYDMLRIAFTYNAKWYWDATYREWYWQTDDGLAAKGYQPTPDAMKRRLDDFAALGYSMFGVWAVGQGDALFYTNAEDFHALAPLVVLPAGSSQSVTDLEGSCSVGSFALEVLENPANSLAAVMQTTQLHGKKARLRLGYAGENASQFPVFDTLEVERVEVNEGQTGWQLELLDPKRTFKSRIFTEATKEDPLVLTGNPMDILLMVYQNHLGIGQNPHLDSSAWLRYVPGDPATLINPNRYVDVATILGYRNGIFEAYHMEFSITGAEEGKGWVEKEIYKALGGYSMVDAQGRISPRFWLAPPLGGVSPVFTFTDRNLVQIPAAARASIINQLTFRLDYDGSTFQTELFFFSGDSISTFDLQGAQIVESKGLRAARQGFLHAGLLASKLFRRYGSLVPWWSIKAFHAATAVEVGDLVELTHPLALDPVSNARGISGVLCEVLEKQPDYAGASVSFKLLDVRYLAGKKSYQIAADGAVPDWTSASAAQKATYMFSSSDSTGLYSDGATGNPIYG